MFESSKLINPPVISGRARFEKNGRIPAGAGAGYDIRCNPSKYTGYIVLLQRSTIFGF